jgi:hypothetical protein
VGRGSRFNGVVWGSKAAPNNASKSFPLFQRERGCFARVKARKPGLKPIDGLKKG